jgi:hypothetical protein
VIARHDLAAGDHAELLKELAQIDTGLRIIAHDDSTAARRIDLGAQSLDNVPRKGDVSGAKRLAETTLDDVATRAEAIANKRGVTLEQLLRLSLDEKLARDAELEEAVTDVLAENAELYRRLA